MVQAYRAGASRWSIESHSDFLRCSVRVGGERSVRVAARESCRGNAVGSNARRPWGSCTIATEPAAAVSRAATKEGLPTSGASERRVSKARSSGVERKRSCFVMYGSKQGTPSHVSRKPKGMSGSSHFSSKRTPVLTSLSLVCTSLRSSASSAGARKITLLPVAERAISWSKGNAPPRPKNSRTCPRNESASEKIASYLPLLRGEQCNTARTCGASFAPLGSDREPAPASAPPRTCPKRQAAPRRQDPFWKA
mmetsp:Transcript_19744/g.63355  ORF Transcript_19744/g.63355 Transcript_19744/m.63355 type:complete len:252 (-) Transcript_19744:1627-2382(-)